MSLRALRVSQITKLNWHFSTSNVFHALFLFFFSKLFYVAQLGRACSQIDCMHTGSPCFSKRHLFVHDLTTIRDPFLRLQMIDEWRVSNSNQLLCKTTASMAPYFFLDGEAAHVWMTRFGRACPQYCWEAPRQDWRGRVGKERASNQPSCQQIASTPFLLFTNIEYFFDRPNHFLTKSHFYHIYPPNNAFELNSISENYLVWTTTKFEFTIISHLNFILNCPKIALCALGARRWSQPPGISEFLDWSNPTLDWSIQSHALDTTWACVGELQKPRGGGPIFFQQGGLIFQNRGGPGGVPSKIFSRIS